MRPRIAFLVLMIIILASCSGDEFNIAVPQPPIDQQKNKVVELEVEGVPVVVAGNKELNLLVAFQRSINGNVIQVTETNKSLPALFEDTSGNVYNLLGKIITGPDVGGHLSIVQTTYGFWFAISNFFPGLEIYNQTSTFLPPSVNLNDENWLVPADMVFAAAGVDNIPSLDSPEYIDIEEENENASQTIFTDNELALVVDFGNEQRIYPIPILDYHEIVNDSYGDFNFSLMYCPLTGTTNIWDRNINGTVTTFGVSGLLYGNNLLPYDRATSSIWIQITGACINGDFIGSQANHLPVLQTTLGVARRSFPAAKILNSKTGFDRNYDRYPYGDYRSNHDLLLFPNQFYDNRLENKDLVLAIHIDDYSVAVPLTSF